MFTRALFMTALIALTSASPTILSSRQQPGDTVYYLAPTAKAAGTAVDGAVLNAADGGLFIGKNTATSCPSNYLTCGDFTNITAITLTGSSASMDVAVPGGQAAYISGDGAFGFSSPAAGIPPTATQTGFTRIERFAPTETYAAVWFKGSDWLACPVADSVGVYQVRAAAIGDKTGCIYFEMAAIEVGSEEPQAYQYDSPLVVS
ncbi:hypothetical protein LHYA1_G000419 [Lachnellula hyalina]|uniref:Cell wall protein n=1 Tax=Lachnellula hyalina TaxID=1316788 RepID=A0A8H8R948_9HELO|nr:uncharacterized protein LHYA1_G000419 [Lachnellula hyalina]TVY30797.1 hypothetical protein LHYA1_G000419 [Lachnellula hyalina]